VDVQIIVAADGIYSLGLEVVLEGEKLATPHEVHNICACFLIDADDIEADPETRWFNNHADWPESSTSANGMLRIYTYADGDQIVTFPCREWVVCPLSCVWSSANMERC
jgi:salicylate hydroxylase